MQRDVIAVGIFGGVIENLSDAAHQVEAVGMNAEVVSYLCHEFDRQLREVSIGMLNTLTCHFIARHNLVFITDEIFGAAIAVKGKLNPYYIFGMATVASPGWVVGTALGVALGNVLPESVISALSVGLFGMFIAIIIPEGKKNKVVAAVIVVSFVASYLLSIIPVVKGIDSGIKIIVLTAH